jgi:anti-sigma B factor antagonist
VKEGGPLSARTWRFSLERTLQGDVLIVAVGGRLGFGSSGALIESLVGAIDEGHRRIVVDLLEVDYVSSAALLALDAVAGRMHYARGHLVLCELTEPVALAFELSALAEHFSLEPTRRDAIARAAGSAKSQ